MKKYTPKDYKHDWTYRQKRTKDTFRGFTEVGSKTRNRKTRYQGSFHIGKKIAWKWKGTIKTHKNKQGKWVQIMQAKKRKIWVK